MMPVMGLAVIESVELLAQCTQAFIDFCALEMEANRAACEKQVEWSMAMVTSLNPLIGYDAAAAIAKEAFKTGKTVRDLCLEKIKAGTLKKKDSDDGREGSGAERGARPARHDGAGEGALMVAFCSAKGGPFAERKATIGKPAPTWAELGFILFAISSIPIGFGLPFVRRSRGEACVPGPKPGG